MTDAKTIALASIEALAAVLAASGHANAARHAVERGIASVEATKPQLTRIIRVPGPQAVWPRVPFKGTVR